MIDKDNFRALLKRLGFTESKDIFGKNFGDGVSLSADFKNRELRYPVNAGLKINERQTCNFSSAENAVVFECVHRLLEKGYKPEHIEIEPRWKVGHGASGGRADILVKSNNEDNKTILIIECKTAGNEYDKEKNKMEAHGGQLFSYLQQDRNTKYLCLYASELTNQEVQYQNAIVKIADRQENIDDFKNGDESIKLYRDANTKEELFSAWKETNNLYFHFNGIFENDVNAYEIELKPLKKKDLKPLAQATGMFNVFMEILRHNNISDNANAFNRILSLLLCKIVDEQKGEGEILDFQVKEGEDTPEKIQDRLQKLYAEGMKQYLDEEIVYFEDKVIQDIIKKYPRQTPIEKVEEIFKQIKYYTQNEFAIKEVHNRNLFLKNAKVLNEVVRLLQNYKFRYAKKQQILGDFFELLLNHGVKQSEGQFFTPVPIVRFIILSIGIDRIAAQKLTERNKLFLPKILDYACGSGHFLTESIDELQKFIEHINTNNVNPNHIDKLAQCKKSTEWAKDYIFGIEKDYRLARTSQIACFLNGDGDANIIFGDGLEPNDRLQLKNKFDVIISNPPYSIKAFKKYLKVNDKEFALYNDLGETSSEIETLFLERTAQLLKVGGKAGIILPSSILNKDSVLHQNTRKLLLENFVIKGISEMGGQTFGATGTKTVILFLEKRSKDFKKDRKHISEDLFGRVPRPRDLDHINSSVLMKKFINYRQLNQADYQGLLQKKANENFKKTELWAEYQEWFNNLTQIRNLKKSNSFNALSAKEQKTELDRRFYAEILTKEEEKFYYFMLSFNDAHQPQQVVISKSGEKNIEKVFLGYEFSERKGSQGIKINRDEKGNIQNKLYNEENYNDASKVNSYILKNFYNEKIASIEESISEHVSTARLTDMLDFSRVNFNKALSLNPQINGTIENDIVNKNKWALVKLGEILETLESGNRPKGGVGNITEGAWSLGGEHIHSSNGRIDLNNPKYVSLDFYSKNEKGILKENDILICKDGALTGKVALLRNELNNKKAMINEHIFLLRCANLTNQKYIFNFLFSQEGQNLLKNNITGTAQGGLNATNLKEIKIPIPSKEVQEKIVTECEAVDQAGEQARRIIDNAKKEIDDKVVKVFSAGYEEAKLGEICDLKAGEFVSANDIHEEPENDLYACYGGNGLRGYTKSYTHEGTFSLIGRQGALCGNVHKVSGVFHATEHAVVATPISSIDTNWLYYILVSLNLNKYATGVAQPGISVKNILPIYVPVPSLSDQQKLVAKVEKLEEKIKQARETLTNASEQKREILDKYLK